MNADKKTNELSAFIGVYRRPNGFSQFLTAVARKGGRIRNRLQSRARQFPPADVRLRGCCESVEFSEPLVLSLRSEVVLQRQLDLPHAGGGPSNLAETRRRHHI